MERAVYDRMAEIDEDHWWFTSRRKIIDRVIRSQVSPPGDARILEVGCGTGSNLNLLQRFGRVEAIEPDDAARKLARLRGGVEVMDGMLPDGVKLDDFAYDLIVMLDVLEHIPDDRSALEALRSKLRAGGRILLTVPAVPWLWSAHDVAHHHERRYTGNSLSKVVRASGYRICYRSYFNTVLFPLIAMARCVGKLSGREGGDDAMPPAVLNTILGALFSAESAWVGRYSLPIGVSLVLVAEPA
jgi:2-polyprenyl-3-methyl-5-hydroxy-6-metoxy-1,4-benzoquinol methylase